MNILILSNSHPYKTAGIVAKDLLHSFRENEKFNVKLIVRVFDFYKDKDIINILSLPSYILGFSGVKLKSILRRIGIKSTSGRVFNPDYAIQDYDQTQTFFKTERILKKARFKPDIVIVLFMQHFLSFKNLYELNKITSAPILLYMADMAPMTGGCHYAWDCKGYLEKCGNCPAMKSELENDQSRRNWLFKNKYIKKTNITVIAGTEWQYFQLLQSSLFMDKPKTKIILPIDEIIFCPGDKTISRSKLKLPLHKKIIFFGANTINSKRKGFKQLFEAFDYLFSIISNEDKEIIHLVIAGRVDTQFFKKLSFNYTIVGHLSHIDLAEAFRAADVFVSPSIEDSGPMMVNQSIMCGTPVVSFKTGVALDLVKSGKTGYSANNFDTEEFARGIFNILNMDESETFNMSHECRMLGQRLCNPHRHIESLLKIISLS